MTNNPIRLIDIDRGKYSTIRVCFSLIRQPKSLSFNGYLLLFTTCFLLIGCSATQPPVPVVDRVKTDSAGSTGKPAGVNNLNNQFHIVQKGDTLYGIALNHGIDFKKLAEWNDIVDPRAIRPGQRINLFMPERESQPALFALSPQPVETTIESPTVQPSVVITQESSSSNNTGQVKTSPKALKLPFSEQNVARLQYSTNPAPAPVAQTLPSSPVSERNTRIEIAPQPVPQKSDRVANDSDTKWIWPTDGKLLSSFSKNSKGVKISGQAGQPVLASAAGEVVYSGHGLRGYGNLIIIKHDNTFLSAYAHNSKILVKEGEAVVKGQKIAEMGNTDTDTIQLHFEIRKHGKPVDPLEFLPRIPG